MRAFLATREGSVFGLVWFGQLVSNVGSSITTFGLGLWVFDETGSASRLALIVLAARLPMLVASPFAGALVDRWDRRLAMIVADAGAAVGTLATVLLLVTGRLEIWHLYVTLSFSGLFRAFQFPAYSAATTLLVPRAQYGRAAGMVQLAGGIGHLAAPALAGVLIVTTGLTTVFVIDFVTFAVAVVTLLAVRFPEPERSEAPPRGVAALLAEAREGLRFVTARRGLLILLLTFTAVNFAFSFLSVLLIPLLLAVTTETVAGTVASVSAIGLVGGSLVMSVWGGPGDRVRGLLAAIAVVGAGFALSGVSPRLGWILVGLTVIHAVVPIAASLSQAIWQSKVPAVLQGRVFAVRQVLAIAAAPVAFLLAGQLADRVFEPMMDEGGTLAVIFGDLIGAGPGRGIGLMLMVLGMAVIVIVAFASTRPAIRHLDEMVPDIELDDQPVDV